MKVYPENQPPKVLYDIQKWLKWIIIDPRGVETALYEGSSHEPHPRLLREIVNQPPLSQIERLNIYAEGYFLRLVEALENDYQALYSTLGDDLFRILISEYLEVYPSRFSNIADAGRHLPHFLKTQIEMNEFPFLSDLARLEWATLEAFYKNPSVSVNPATFSSLTEEQWNQAIILLDYSVQLLELEWKVDKLYHNRNQGKTHSNKPQQKQNWVLVYQKEGWPEVEELNSTQWTILTKIHKEKPLGVIFEKIMAQSVDDITVNELSSFQDWFRHWVTNGVICGVKFDSHLE